MRQKHPDNSLPLRFGQLIKCQSLPRNYSVATDIMRKKPIVKECGGCEGKTEELNASNEQIKEREQRTVVWLKEQQTIMCLNVNVVWSVTWLKRSVGGEAPKDNNGNKLKTKSMCMWREDDWERE